MCLLYCGRERNEGRVKGGREIWKNETFSIRKKTERGKVEKRKGKNIMTAIIIISVWIKP